jgi:hypothetical protein
MFRDRPDVLIEQFAHLFLTEPNGVTVKPYIEGGLAILGFIENNFAQIIPLIIHFSSLEGLVNPARL